MGFDTNCKKDVTQPGFVVKVTKSVLNDCSLDSGVSVAL